MARIDFKKVYEDRIKEIDRTIRKMVITKDWREYGKLKEERNKLKEKIKEL